MFYKSYLTSIQIRKLWLYLCLTFGDAWNKRLLRRIIIIFMTQNSKGILFRPNRPHVTFWVDFSLSQVRPRAYVFFTAAIKTDPVAHRPRLCKCGGARMAHNAKDRVTNQEFASCHSWVRRRRQKLGITRFSSEGNTRKAANSVAISLSRLLPVSTFPDALGNLRRTKRRFFLKKKYFSWWVWTRHLCTMTSFRVSDGINFAPRESDLDRKSVV